MAKRAVRDYEKLKQRARQRNAEITLAGQDIAPLPAIVNPRRRQRADKSFKTFCETYFPRLFYLKWSDDHLKVIAKIERAIVNYEQFAVAMPRGSGKTTLCEIGAIWGIATGRHEFVILIAATEKRAAEMIENIKTHLMANDALLADYPEMCYPIRQLEGESRRCTGQRYYGVPTHIGWGVDEVVMPTLPGSRCSGAIVRVAGITGHVRGAKYVRADGTQVRPTLALPDDPQTNQSAASLLQTESRLEILQGAIAGLAGPGQRTAILMPCTVIRDGDLADRALDRQKHPEWRGERYKMLYTFPKNEKLWNEYAQLRAESLRNDGDGKEATAFYRKHRKAMDAGAAVAWPARYNKKGGEISALQHAMNLRFKDERAFWAEYQNEPIKPDVGGSNLTEEALSATVRNVPRATVPSWCDVVTAGVDVHDDLIFWLVAAWAKDGFTGHVLDYGAWPDQRTKYFHQGSAKKPLTRQYPGRGKEAAIRAGLDHVVRHLLDARYKGQDGSLSSVARAFIDSGHLPDVVYQAVAESDPRMVSPSRGVGVGAKGRPFGETRSKRPRREVLGDNWREAPLEKYREVRLVTLETNHWKTFVRERLATSTGDPGALSLCAGDHELLVEHLLGEYGELVEAGGRKVVEWSEKPNGQNHWWDCLVEAAVAASREGCRIAGVTGAVAQEKPRQRVSFAQLQQQRRNRS